MPFPGAPAQVAPLAPATGAAPAGKSASSITVGSGSSEISPVAGTHAGQPVVTAAVAEGASRKSGASPGSNNSSGGGSAKGWGGWLAPASLGGLSSKLQQVAMGAAKDLQELTASVQQVSSKGRRLRRGHHLSRLQELVTDSSCSEQLGTELVSRIGAGARSSSTAGKVTGLPMVTAGC
jgi:hypothetical protein